MNPLPVIFLSAVSSEFHNSNAFRKSNSESTERFLSYRDVLYHAFWMLAPHYQVVMQENLPIGFGDLLETLDQEIARSSIVIHLVGDMAGSKPEVSQLHNLLARHPHFLQKAPHLIESIGAGDQVTYTQWEVYLAFHHERQRLIFQALPDARRSPSFAPTAADKASQQAHLRRIAKTGHHRGYFHDQSDVARKSMRAFLHFHADPKVDPVKPSEDALKDAWAHREQIVHELAEAIINPDPRAVPIKDTANVAAFVAAVRAAATRWAVNLTTIVEIASNHESIMCETALNAPSAQALHNEALAKLALGDYTASAEIALRAAHTAIAALEKDPENQLHNHQAIENFLLYHEVANVSNEIERAIEGLRMAAARVDKHVNPVLWTEIHERLAKFLIEHTRPLLDHFINTNRSGVAKDDSTQNEVQIDDADTAFVRNVIHITEEDEHRNIARAEEADKIIRQIITIRANYQGDNRAALARSLLLSSFSAYRQFDLARMDNETARAVCILVSLPEPHLHELAAALNSRSRYLSGTDRFAEAEVALRQAVAFEEQAIGATHPDVAMHLSDLAALLHTTNHHAEAETIYRRVLAILEQHFGCEHPKVATTLTNLAGSLTALNRYTEAEPLCRRALDIDERSHGVNHLRLVRDLLSLTNLLLFSNRVSEAKKVFPRAMAILVRAIGELNFSGLQAIISLNGYLLDSFDTNYDKGLSKLLKVLTRVAETMLLNWWTEHGFDFPVRTVGADLPPWRVGSFDFTREMMLGARRL